MNQETYLADQFEANRSHLRAVAYRMLGSTSEADDAVQEAWFRLSRVAADEIENLGGWLTTVVARICLDMLRTRTSRHEEPLEVPVSARIAAHTNGIDPEYEALLADSVGLALLVVLESLEPAERVAFVLHDMFAVPFDEIAPIVGRSSSATRQLASRARRRARQAATISNDEFTVQREIASAFLTAVRAGDVDALLAVLDPEVVLRGGGVAAATGEPRVVQGATNVAAGAVLYARTVGAVRLALVDGAVALVWLPDGNPRAIFKFRTAHGRMIEIDIINKPERLKQIDITLFAR